MAYYFSDILNTTDETLEFLKRPGLESIGLLDTHHIFLEDRSMEESLLQNAPGASRISTCRIPIAATRRR